MKNIIIYGSGRSGKSALARIIKNKWGGHNWFPLDPLREIYDVVSDENSKNDWTTDIAVLTRKWSKIINTAITQFAEEANRSNEFFVFEGWGIDLESLLPKIDTSKFVIIGIGYPNISTNEKLNQMLKYETTADWTKELSLQEKQRIVEYLCDEDKYIKAQIDKFKIPFFDTSFEREKVYDEIMDYLEKRLK